MPQPSLPVQNLLAQAASLLFRVGETLGESPCLETQSLLKIEIAGFFSEGRKSLSAALSEKGTPTPRESGQSAQNAESFGAALTSEEPVMERVNTSSHDGPASCMGMSISPEAPSGNSSSGGTGESPQAWGQHYHSSPTSFSAGSAFSARIKSSGRFLGLTNSNGNPMLIAVDDISNIVGLPSGGCAFFYKSQLDPDNVRESLREIMELLNG